MTAHWLLKISTWRQLSLLLPSCSTSCSAAQENTTVAHTLKRNYNQNQNFQMKMDTYYLSKSQKTCVKTPPQLENTSVLLKKPLNHYSLANTASSIYTKMVAMINTKKLYILTAFYWYRIIQHVHLWWNS